MATILLNCVTIAMETTSLRTSIPMLFTSTDAIFLGIFIIEFVMKVKLEYMYIMYCRTNSESPSNLLLTNNYDKADFLLKIVCLPRK